MLDYDARLAIADATLANGGGTFTTDGQPVQPTAGYAVAVQSIPYGGALTSRNGIVDALGRANGNGHVPYIGSWVDGETGKVYLDRVVILPDRESALTLAAAFGELAIWDFATGTEVRVNTAEAA